jgi:hypothetical protein
MRRLIVAAAIAAAMAPAFMAITPVTAASAASNCTTSEFVIQNYEGATMVVETNGHVKAVKGAQTEFCQTLENSHGPLYTIYEENEQSKCLTGSGGVVVVTTSCSGTDAEWHEYPSKAYSGWSLLQWEGNLNCATQNGPQPAEVTLPPCADKRGDTSPIWTV